MHRRVVPAHLVAVVAALVAVLVSLGTAQAAPPMAGARDITSFACQPGEVPAAGFVDTGDNVFAADIECLAWYEITEGGPAGLPPDHYGPRLEVGRGQMATFLARILDHVDPGLLSAPWTGDRFADIAGNVHAEAINRLAEAGLVFGGPGGRRADQFGPELTVNRGQMASFIHRLHAFANGGDALVARTDYFDDDNRVAHERAIDALAGAGIVQGRATGTYAPEAPVPRGAMAAFVMRVVDLLIENGATSPPAGSDGSITTVPPAPTTTTVAPTTTTTVAAPPPEVLVEQSASDLGSIDSALVFSGDTAVTKSSVPIPGTEQRQDSVRVLVRGPEGWATQAELVADDWRLGDDFGLSVAIDGDTVVVGAPDHNAGDAPRQGAAYVFVRSGTTWSQQAKLVVTGGGMDDRVGSAVAVSGGTAAVGSRDKPAPEVRAVHVYVRVLGLWLPQETIEVFDTADELDNVMSLAIDGDTLAVGTALSNGSRGSVQVYARSGGTWSLQDLLTDPDGTSLDFFGLPLALSGDTLAVGATRLFSPGVGTVHVFVRSGTTWALQTEVADPDPGDLDVFGISFALAGDRLVVGSPLLEAESGARRGSAHVFVRSGPAWIERQTLVASVSEPADLFGLSVALSGQTVWVVAPGDPRLDDDQRNGLIYAYTLDPLS